MSYTPKVGDRVHVEFDGVVAEYAKVIDDRGVRHSISFFSNPRVVTKAEPASWPPHPGDVWEAEGKLYAISRSAVVLGSVVAREVMSGAIKFVPYARAGNNLDAFKALNPVLVKRQDAS